MGASVGIQSIAGISLPRLATNQAFLTLTLVFSAAVTSNSPAIRFRRLKMETTVSYFGELDCTENVTSKSFR